MKKITRFVLFLLFVNAGAVCWAQTPIKDFTLTNVMDGTAVALSDYSKPVAVIFTSNECAFDSYYNTRIHALLDKYGSHIQFLLINSSIEPDELQEKMTAKYKTWNYAVPYLADKDQQAMEILGARKTPESFLLKKINGSFIIVYHGAIDDNPQVATDVKQTYLQINIDKLLASQKIDPIEIRATGGCTIRRK